MRSIITAAVLTACSLLVACGNSGPTSTPPPSSNPTPKSTVDGSAISEVGTCIPTEGYAGNSLHVGAYCTVAGGQCSVYGNFALQCSSDLSALGGNFCLLVGCTDDSNCGEDGCCTAPGGQGIHACIPVGCFDAGVCSPIAPN